MGIDEILYGFEFEVDMNIEKLHNHIKLCRKNLKSSRVKCCAACPFEDEILCVFPNMDKAFEAKRQFLGMEKRWK